MIQLIKVEESCFTLSCQFRNCEDNFTWAFTRVYGPKKGSLGKTCGGSWVQLKVYGGTLGALEVISMWFVFQGRETGLVV